MRLFIKRTFTIERFNRFNKNRGVAAASNSFTIFKIVTASIGISHALIALVVIIKAFRKAS
jgi:hypothetical protein